MARFQSPTSCSASSAIVALPLLRPEQHPRAARNGLSRSSCAPRARARASLCSRCSSAALAMPTKLALS
eukprot:9469511-Pyramimonas_sp.AAC.1